MKHFFISLFALSLILTGVHFTQAQDFANPYKPPPSVAHGVGVPEKPAPVAKGNTGPKLSNTIQRTAPYNPQKPPRNNPGGCKPLAGPDSPELCVWDGSPF